MKRLIITFLLIAGSMLAALGSLYRSYQTDDGLSHNSVWAVMQDSRGFMWFGTNDGLNRFDGLNFKVYRRNENDSLSLGNNFIHCLLEASDGNILVGTKEGLYCYSPDSDKFAHISLDGHAFGDDRNSIHCLMLDRSGRLWVGCYGQGIYCLDSGLNVTRHYGGSSLPSRFVTAMALDISGSLWVGTDNAGLFRLDPATGKTAATPINNAYIQSLYRQSDNTLWVSISSEGLFHYDPLSNVVRHISGVGPGCVPVNDIKALTPCGAGELVMGSEMGLLHLDCNSRTLSSFDDGSSYDNLPDKSIFAIARDNEGGLWLGTYFYGVCYRSPRINAFSFYPTGADSDTRAANNIVRRMAEATDGNIMLTSPENGVRIFDPATQGCTLTKIAGLSDNVQSVMANGEDFWISDYNRGIVVASYPSGRTKATYSTAHGLPSNVVNTMYRTSRGQIYAGTTRGAAVYDGQGHFTVLPQLGTASVMTILEDYEGNLWFATHFHGLFRMNASGDFTNYSSKAGDPTTLPGNNINNIYLDSRGMLWTGTEGEGLVLFNPTSGKVERRFTESTDGLPSNIIYSTQEDCDGNMWVSTGGGLIKIAADGWRIYDFHFLESLLKIHYTHNSSMRSANGGTLYFGGSGGFISFNPKEIEVNELVPTVRVTDFYINGQRSHLPDGGEIELSASESTFSFNVACLSYLSPTQNVVAYRLKGFDRDWKTLPGTDRHIDYMNIPSGEYTMQIKGSNNDGVWSEPLEVGIVVNRPLLLSNVMLAVYALLLILAGYLLKRRLDASHRRKMVKFSHAKEKELYEAKIGFFTNIAHEIRTPLSLISAPLETIISSGDGNERTRRNLVVMKSNVRRLLELINQLLDFRKVESQLMHLSLSRCDASEIVQNICNRYEEFSALHTITIDRSGIENGIECTLDAEAFEKIVGNLMSNAMKFADKRITVKMTVDRSSNMLRLEIADDGPGIKEKDLDRIFESFYQVDDHGKHPGSGLGLPLAQSLARMHQGEITVKSEYGHGSCFTVCIPTTLAPDVIDVPDTNSAEPAATEQEADESTADTDSTQPTVLIVEDNDELRAFVTDNFADSFRVYSAPSGIEAFAIIESKNVDIIISDIMMPDMDGIELCRALRNNPTYSHLPVILLSAKTDVETKVEGLNVGADAYVEKPFSVEQLMAQTRSILDSRRRMRENFIKSPLDFYKKPHAEDAQAAENAEFVSKLNDLILENLTNSDFNIDGLARMFYMSRSNFHKRVKGITGKTPNDYIRIVRLSKAAELLATGRYQIVEVCYMVGFNTPSYFSKCFAEHYGKLPKDYINDL